MFRRHLLGAVALVLLGIGVWYLWQGTRSSGEELVSGSCLRIGAVLAVVWLAWPDLARLPPFVCIVGGLSLLVILKWPALIVYLLPILVLLWFLQPKRGSSSRPLSSRTGGKSRSANTTESGKGLAKKKDR